jgi:myo-inositol-1-phosphate synthase
MLPGKVRVAIIGVGNCASSLVQGVEFYKDAKTTERVPGLMHPVLGPYHVKDIEFSAGFDVNRTKVGKPLSEAIFADPNNTQRFATPPMTDAKVFRGPTHDGIGKYLTRTIEVASEEPVNVAEVLKETGTEVLVSYLPVGSEIATR